MTQPLEFWAFVFSNLLLLLSGGALTALSYRAYQRTARSGLRTAVAGFGIITLGTLVEAIYELGIRGTYELAGRELLALHTVESIVIVTGLVALFYSVVRY